MSDSGPGDDVRFRVIRAVAALDGYEHPNTYPGSWWDVRMAPVVAMVRDLIKEARSAAAPDMAQERARALRALVSAAEAVIEHTRVDGPTALPSGRTVNFGLAVNDMRSSVEWCRALLAVAAAAPDGIAATGLDALADDAGRIASWLETVGWHSVSCPSVESDSLTPCTCGYAKALTGARDLADRLTPRAPDGIAATGLDVERLKKVFLAHREKWHVRIARLPDGSCVEECMAELAAEYARLAATPAESGAGEL